ncbi:hypothetical protein [Bartonella sp. DGB1]|uniref:hypothetical protein n=1 Tax=Bartonella sp. DGB1 TaxID=3239807 RepID=UPI0035269DC8
MTLKFVSGDGKITEKNKRVFLTVQEKSIPRELAIIYATFKILSRGIKVQS